MPDKRRSLRLGDRDYDIFAHIMKYRMTTREVLHRLFFADSDLNAVTKVTSRLVTHKYLNRHSLYEPRTYFTLGPEAASLFALSGRKTVALGSQSLPRELGMLNFCCLSDTPRERLRVAEVREQYPTIVAKKVDSSSYYLDHDGKKTRLAYMRVDHGGPTSHVLRKCRSDVRVRQNHAPLQELIETDRFLIAVITAHEEKKQMIEHALRQQSWRVQFRIEVVSDLAHLLTRKKPSA